MANNEGEPPVEENGEEGRRQDGRPYAPGNTREDGTYKVGKWRPSEATQFRKDDGRPRGRRTKGTKNLATDWREELNEKITVVENGVRKRRTKQRAIVKKTVERAAKGNDRASETAYRFARECEETAPGLRASDHEIIDAWLAQRGLGAAPRPRVSDDFDDGSELEAGDEGR